MKSKLLGVLFVTVILSVNCVKAQNQIVEADLLSYNESGVINEIDEKENKTTLETPKETLTVVADKEESDENTSFPAVQACSISGNTTICSGQSTTLTASGGTTYLWSNGATTAAITVSPSTTTTYTVTAYYVLKQSVCSQVVTVNPTPTAAITGTNKLCAGSSTTLTATGGGSYLWNTTPAATTSQITVTPANTTIYRVTVTSAAGCTATALRVVSVDQWPVVTVTGSDSICVGSTATLCSHSYNQNITYLWSNGATPSPACNMSTGECLTYIYPTPTSTSNYSVTVTTTGAGCTSTAQKTVVVSPQSVGGSVTGGTTICSGSTSGVLALSGKTGSVVRWESSVSPFSTWTPITNTNTTYTSGALTQNTQFRAVVKSGVCAEANSAATTVTVSPATVEGTVSGGTTICTGSTSALLTLAGHTGTVVRWESSVSPFSTWTPITNTNTTYTSGALTQTTQFRAVVQSSPCATANSAATTVTVNPATVGGTVSGGTTICAGSTSALLTLAGHTGTIVRWESSVSPFSTWTPITNTHTTYTSGALTATTQFRAVVQSSPCATANSAATTVTVNPLPTLTGVSQVSAVCAGSSATISLTGLLANKTFTVSYSLDGDAQTPVTSVVSDGSGVASFTTVALNAGDNGRKLIIDNISTTSTTPNCSQSFSNFVYLSVSPTSVGGSVTGGTTICSGSISPLLTLAGHTGTVVRWESSVSPFSTWTPITNTNTTYTSGALTQTTQFRAVVKSGACAEANSSATTVTVNLATVGGSVTGGTTICSGSTSGLLTLSGNIGSVRRWESSVSPFSTWTPISNIATTYTSGVLTQTTQFRAIIQNGGVCEQEESAFTTVTVNPLPTATAGSNSPICSGKTLSLTSSGGTSYSWLSTNGYYSTAQNPSIQITTTENAGTYTVTVTDDNSCTSTAQVVVEIKAQPIITNIVNNLICVGGTIELKSNGGTTYEWSGPNGYSSSDPINSIMNATANRSGIYTVTVSNNDNCTTTATSIVQVSDKPIVNAGNDVIACSGTLVTLTATGGNTYTWSTGEHTASIMVNPRLTTTYSVEATNLAGCKAVDQVDVTVKPAISLFSVLTKPSNCTKGGNINLSGSEIGISYQLLKDGVALGNPIAGTGDALFFQSVTSNGTYTIKATRVNDGCERIMNGSSIIN